MSETQGRLLCRCAQVSKFIKNGVQFTHLSIPEPTARRATIDGTGEDYFIFEENGQPVLLEVSSRTPLILSRVDRNTPNGGETWNRVCDVLSDVAHLFKG